MYTLVHPLLDRAQYQYPLGCGLLVFGRRDRRGLLSETADPDGVRQARVVSAQCAPRVAAGHQWIFMRGANPCPMVAVRCLTSVLPVCPGKGCRRDPALFTSLLSSTDIADGVSCGRGFPIPDHVAPLFLKVRKHRYRQRNVDLTGMPRPEHAAGWFRKARCMAAIAANPATQL